MSKIENRNLRIDGDRLWDSLMAMSQIGATPNGGVSRPAFSRPDAEGRDLLVRWCEAAGCRVRIDAIGNIFARRSGSNDELPAVMAGSHLDSQACGGKFDGAYGVLAGLEVIRCLNEHDVSTTHPIEIVVWANEEGSRFSPAMMGSGVFSGVFELAEMLSIEDREGESVAVALNDSCPSRQNFDRGSIKMCFEVHIEQGPILEANQKQIGVVSGIQGIRWLNISIFGVSAHAGPTPMDGRKDPVRAVAEIINQGYDIASSEDSWARITFGDIRAAPGSHNTVPSLIMLAVDLRHPNENVLCAIEQRFRDAIIQACEKFGVTADIATIWSLPAVRFSQDCIEKVVAATQLLGYTHMGIVSGAGHDTGYIAKIAPASMIFIPCQAGISHNEKEHANKDDVAAGGNVLLHSMLLAAG